MIIYHMLFFCFSSALLNGNTGLVNAKARLYTKLEGEDVRDGFELSVPTGSRKYLSKSQGDKDDVLVETHGNRATSGRYIIRYDPNDSQVHVVIKELTKSDEGWYKVGVSTSSSLDKHEAFEIKVVDLCESVVYGEPRVQSATVGGNITITCSLFSNSLNRKFLCRDKCNKVLVDSSGVGATSERYKITYGSRDATSRQFNVTILKLTPADSGRYRCGVVGLRQPSGNRCQEIEITVTGGATLRPAVYFIVVALLAACLLLLYKWRIRHVDYVNTRGTGTNTVQETSIYENCAPVSMPEESTYLDLDPDSREHSLYYSLQT